MTSPENLVEKSFQIPFGEKTIDAILTENVDHSSDMNGGIILTHGAGGDMNTPQLPQVAQHLAESGFTCVRFTCKALNLKYRIKVFKSVVKHTMEIENWTWCSIGGRSMGSRAAVSTANDFQTQPGKPVIKGVVCLSYPLHPPNDDTKLRDDILRDCNTPVLFISGTFDSQCKKVLMDDIVRVMDNVRMHWMEGGDHGLNVKGQGKIETITEICSTVSSWCKTTMCQTIGKPSSEQTVDRSARSHTEELLSASTSKRVIKKRGQKRGTTKQKDMSKRKKKK